MARREFSKETKRAALKRSEKRCEAVGTDYGLEPRERCYGDLSNGVQFDHIIADSIGGEPTLENCAAVCFRCHRIKTAKVDTPRAAKTKRQADKNAGIRNSPHPNFKRPAGSRYDWSRGGRLTREEPVR